MRIIYLFTGVLLIIFNQGLLSQVNMSSNGSHSQLFDGLPTSGSATWTDNSTIANWYSQRTGTGTTVVADAGTGTGGNLYSYGTGTVAERALGALGSGNATAGSFAHGVLLRNTSGAPITDIKVTYTLEQWRNSAAAAQTITFWYKTSSSPISSLTPNNNTGWTQVSGLSLSSPITGGTAGALDGNASANRVTASSVSIPSLNLSNNDYIMLKWEDPDNTGNDHGLSIDDVSISWTISSSCTPPTTPPSGFSATNIMNTSMNVNWSGNGNGDSVIVVARQGSDVTTNPSNGVFYNSNAAFGSGSQIGTGNYVVYRGTGSSVNVTGLSAGTNYYYRIYSFNGTGNCYLTSSFLSGNASTTTPPPVIAHTGTSGTTGNINQGSVNNILYQIKIDVATTTTILNQVIATTGGTWVNGDITNFKLWFSTDNVFGSDVTISTITNPSPGDISFSSLSQSISAGTTRYLFITCDVAAGATINNTVSAFVDADSDISYNNNPTFSNSSFASANLMTIIGVPELQLEYPIGTNLACSGTIPFGSIVVGQTTSLTFRIKNTGTADLNLTTLPLTIGGTNANQFSITTQPTSPVSAGSFVDVVVQFAPSSTGAKTANISIANNDGDENPCAVNLTGTGTLANDDCSGAIALSVSGSPTCGGTTSGTTVGATNSGIGGILCNSLTGIADDDVWYSFVAASTSHIITVVGSNPLDAVVDLRSGVCNGNNIACADLTGAGGTETLTATSLNVGSTYFVRIYDYYSGSTTQGAFTICITTPPPPFYFRSKASGLWSAASTWEVSTDNINWSDATSAPTSIDLNINIRSPHAVTLNSNVTLDQTTVETGSTLEVSSTLTILDGTGDDLLVYGILKNTDGSFTTTGTISIENGGKYQHNPTSGGGTLPTCSWKTGSICEIIKATADPGTSLNQTYYNFIWNSSNQVATNLNLNSHLKTVNGDLTIQNTGTTGTLRLAGTSSLTLNVLGNLIIETGTRLWGGGGSQNCIMNINGNLTINGTGTFDLMGGSSATSNLNLKGNLNAASTSTLTENTSGAVNFAFIGTSQQTATFGTVGNQIKFEINCSPGVSLGSDLTMLSTQDLKLTLGYLQLNNFNLDMSVSTTTLTGGSSSSFIITNGTGVLKRTVAGSNVSFPIGNSNYNPLILLNSGTSDVFSASVNDAVFSNGTSGTEYTENVVDRTWTLTEKVAGGSNVTATFQWAASDELSGFDRTLCFTGHYNNGWQNGTAGPATGSNPYTRTRTGITSFSPFAVGSFGALPVELVNFNAIANKKQVDLSWTTASEKNNDRFEIERSEDADSFDFIASIKGAGNSFLTNNYSFTDLYPINGISYYRLKQFDFDGEYSYSPIRSVNMVSDLDVNIFPTVTKSEFKLSFGGPLKTDATIDLIAVGSGNIVYSLNIPSETISEMIPVSNIPSGSYFIRINNGQELISKMFIKID